MKKPIAETVSIVPWCDTVAWMKQCYPDFDLNAAYKLASEKSNGSYVKFCRSAFDEDSSEVKALDMLEAEFGAGVLWLIYR
jgi:hypothetical protein